MDPAGPTGHLDRRTAALSLERTIELDNVRLTLREWPGQGGPLIYVPDPGCTSGLLARVVDALAPRYRVLSIGARPDQPYQVQVADLHGMMAQFGFVGAVILAEGIGCAGALLLAAWYPRRVAAVVLVDAGPPDGDALIARSLRDCPPDWARLRQHVTCPVVERASTDFDLVEQLQTLLD